MAALEVESPQWGTSGGRAKAADKSGDWWIAVSELWPPEEWARAWCIDGAESTHGADPGTYDVDAENGGRMQINKESWENLLREEYGWTWEQVVLDDRINLQASRVIYDLAGGSWAPWTTAAGCAR